MNPPLRFNCIVAVLLIGVGTIACNGVPDEARPSQARSAPSLSSGEPTGDSRHHHWDWFYLELAQEQPTLTPTPERVVYRLVFADMNSRESCVVTATGDRSGKSLRVTTLDSHWRPNSVLRRAARELSTAEWHELEAAAVDSLFWSAQPAESEAFPIPDGREWSLAGSNDHQARYYDCHTHSDTSFRFSPIISELHSLAGTECRY